MCAACKACLFPWKQKLFLQWGHYRSSMDIVKWPIRMPLYVQKESKNALQRESKGFSAHSKATKTNKTLPAISESAYVSTLLYCQVNLWHPTLLTSCPLPWFFSSERSVMRQIPPARRQLHPLAGSISAPGLFSFSKIWDTSPHGCLSDLVVCVNK